MRLDFFFYKRKPVIKSSGKKKKKTQKLQDNEFHPTSFSTTLLNKVFFKMSSFLDPACFAAFWAH